MEPRAYGWTHEAIPPSPAHGYITAPLLAALTRHLRKHDKVLDLGCGTGAMTQVIADAGYSVEGAEASEDGVLLARKAHPAITFHKYSVYDPPAFSPPGSFDAVVTVEVLEHLWYPRDLFRSAHALLKPGGLLIVTTPYHGYLKNLAISLVNGWDRHFDVTWDGGHVKFFSRKTIEAMANEQGFEPLEFIVVGRMTWVGKSMILCSRKRTGVHQ